MGKIKYLILMSLCWIGLANMSYAQQTLADQFEGHWQGEGTLMGSEATFDMSWQREMAGQFLKLTFQNKRTPKDGESIVFNATAMYRPMDNIWEGTWFDSRGVSFSVRGTVEVNKLTVEWGNPDIEQGKTVYILKEDKNSMKVTDYILQNGNYTKFGEAEYKKVVQNEEPKVIGIGGIFFKTTNTKETREWYQTHLGIINGERGGSFVWRKFDAPNEYGFTVWHAFDEKADYFKESSKEFMVNYRVNNLDGLLANLKKKGINQVGEIEEYSFGKFAWILDPEGQKIELWEPNDVESLEMHDSEGNLIYNKSN